MSVERGQLWKQLGLVQVLSVGTGDDRGVQFGEAKAAYKVC